MFKKENYEFHGFILPVVYGVIRRTETNEYNRGVAFIGIGATRELALKEPLKEVMVQFEITDRSACEKRLAYLSAKQVKKIETINEEGKLVETEEYPYFYDWEDDIQYIY